MARFRLEVNGRRSEVDVAPETPLVWVLRDHLELTGTKFGCGIAQCGACTVHVDGQPQRSCQLAVSTMEGKAITTIEGLAPGRLNALQQAWIAEEVPQCGYCQSGQLMSASALLDSNAAPSEEEIEVWMSGNICRCGTYNRIKRAIGRAVEAGR